jgi:hypothetical protein
VDALKNTMVDGWISAMRRLIYEIYTLGICLASLIGGVVALFGLLHGVLTWSDPELMLSKWTYQTHQNNERYWQDRMDRSRYRHSNDFRDEGNDRPTRPPEEEITRARMTSLESELAGERRDGKLTTFYAGFGFLVSGVLFCVHWRLSRQARQAVDGNATRIAPSPET